MRDISLVRWKKDATGDDYIETEIKITPSELELLINFLKGKEFEGTPILIELNDKGKALLKKLESL